MISDSENVLTAVVAEAAVVEAVALIRADQDQGHLGHIAETRDRLPADEEIRHPEARRRGATETCMFQAEEEVAKQTMVEIDQPRDLHHTGVVDMVGAQGQAVEVNGMEDRRRGQPRGHARGLSVGRHQDQGRLHVDGSLRGDCRGRLR